MSSTTASTRAVTSTDGTHIAYETSGSGPAVVLVDGALCCRGLGPSRDLAERLCDRFTVLAYDRRGRGESGQGSSPWSVDRELEDLAAVIGAAGGRASLLGVSSGAVIALEAARRGLPVDRVVAYEAPFVLDDSRPPTDPEFTDHVQRLIDEGRRGDAVNAFMTLVGVPAPFRALMRVLPVWRKLTRIAHTLPHDLALTVPRQQGLALEPGYYDAVAAPTAVLAGGKSPASMRHAQVAIAEAVPDARFEEIPGQTHLVKAAVMAPVFARHLSG